MGSPGDGGMGMEDYKHRADELLAQVNKIGQRVNEIEQFYLNKNKKHTNNSKSGSASKDREKDKERYVASLKKHQQDAARREAAASRRMQELIQQFGTILQQITQHKWAWPFMKPVDVEGLGLHDYYEEKRLEEEEAEAQLNMQLAQEAAYAKMARDISNELFEADMNLEELREQLIQRCRKMSTEEKRQLGMALTSLSTEDLSRALEVVAQSNPAFVLSAEVVDLDIDAQSETTLWRLKIFVKDALQAQGTSSVSKGGNNNNNNVNNNNDNNANNNNSKRGKRESCGALGKTARRKSKKLGP